MRHNVPEIPPIVSEAQWQQARSRLLVKEKRLTLAGDALASERRRLPMVKIETDYVFEGADGPSRLVELFEGRRQLILIHFMFGPDDVEVCRGCSMTADNLGHLAHLHARDTTLVLVSRAPQARLQAHRQRMNWAVPWYSSFGTSFNTDFGRTRDGKESSGVSVFLRVGQDVYRTYFTSNRGDEHLGSVWSFLDLTPYGRQENWEDSPEGWPQIPLMFGGASMMNMLGGQRCRAAATSVRDSLLLPGVISEAPWLTTNGMNCDRGNYSRACAPAGFEWA